MNEPDFDCWGHNLVLIDAKALELRVSEALKQAFEQGKHWGKNNGWVEELEADVEWQKAESGEQSLTSIIFDDSCIHSFDQYSDP
jgi:hypothetical protein